MVNFSAVYSVLYALTLALINPWGSSRAEVWTQPKVLAVLLITLLNCWLILGSMRKGALTLPFAWKVGCCLWFLFLGSGLLTTVLSPFPFRSLWGQSTMGDGWAYWLLLAVFVLSNALVLQLEPRLFRFQVYGLLVGGVFVALSIFPQILDWRIDYTITSGKLSQYHPKLLESTIWKGQMPIGLYSHRGHVGFVLAAVAVMSLIAVFNNWVRNLLGIVLYVLVSTPLFFTRNRGAILSLLVTMVYLFWRFYYKSDGRRVVPDYGIRVFWIFCIQFVSYLLFNISVMLPLIKSQQLLSLNKFNQVSTGRLDMWYISLKGIIERPFLGWGFDGWGIAYPFVADWTRSDRKHLADKVPMERILELGNFSFNYLGTDGKTHIEGLWNNKAHNLFLDTAVSVGLLGLIFYIALLVFFLWCTIHTAVWGLEGLAITYLFYTLTWYESAQFSHLAWWSLSVGLAWYRYPKGKAVSFSKDVKSQVSRR